MEAIIKDVPAFDELQPKEISVNFSFFRKLVRVIEAETEDSIMSELNKLFAAKLKNNLIYFNYWTISDGIQITFKGEENVILFVKMDMTSFFNEGDY